MSLLILQKQNTNNKTIFKKLIFSTKVWILSFLKVKCQDTLYSVGLGIDGGFSIIYADVSPLDPWSSISQPESVDLGSFYILLLLVLNGFVKTHTWISLREIHLTNLTNTTIWINWPQINKSTDWPTDKARQWSDLSPIKGNWPHKRMSYKTNLLLLFFAPNLVVFILSSRHSSGVPGTA